jgi:hypothetical protein
METSTNASWDTLECALELADGSSDESSADDVFDEVLSCIWLMLPVTALSAEAAPVVIELPPPSSLDDEESFVDAAVPPPPPVASTLPAEGDSSEPMLLASPPLAELSASCSVWLP